MSLTSQKKRKAFNFGNSPTDENKEEISVTDTEDNKAEVDNKEWESSKEISNHNKEVIKVTQQNKEEKVESHHGNPGQQARFNSVMQNRASNTSKYFR